MDIIKRSWEISYQRIWPWLVSWYVGDPLHVANSVQKHLIHCRMVTLGLPPFNQPGTLTIQWTDACLKSHGIKPKTQSILETKGINYYNQITELQFFRLMKSFVLMFARTSMFLHHQDRLDLQTLHSFLHTYHSRRLRRSQQFHSIH